MEIEAKVQKMQERIQALERENKTLTETKKIAYLILPISLLEFYRKERKQNYREWESKLSPVMLRIQ